MTDSPAIDELEITPRLQRFLDTLGLTTLADIAQIAELRVPKVIAEELELLLADHEIAYPGRFVVIEPPVTKATGTVGERCAMIEAWLQARHPDELATFRPPATDPTIAAVEAALGRTLPDDYKQFLRLHDGQTYGPMVWTCSLFETQQIASAYKQLQSLTSDEDEEFDDSEIDAGVRAVRCSPGWIPIGRSARGRDYLCIDFDPAEGGCEGQIIGMSVDFDDRERIADSFTELLSVFFEQLQTGEIDLGDD